MMFNEVSADNLGLEWEPCHQMVSLIDPMPQLREWVRRIFHVHGKDATVYWDRVRKYGVHMSMHEDVALKSGVQTRKHILYAGSGGPLYLLLAYDRALVICSFTDRSISLFICIHVPRGALFGGA